MACAAGDREAARTAAAELQDIAAMDRWIFHLDEKHPGAEAPCLTYLPEAQGRLHERREQRG